VGTHAGVRHVQIKQTRAEKNHYGWNGIKKCKYSERPKNRRRFSSLGGRACVPISIVQTVRSRDTVKCTNDDDDYDDSYNNNNNNVKTAAVAATPMTSHIIYYGLR